MHRKPSEHLQLTREGLPAHVVRGDVDGGQCSFFLRAIKQLRRLPHTRMEQLAGASQTAARHWHERQLSQRVHKPRVLHTQRVQLVQSAHHRAVALARLQLTQPREHVLAVEAAAPDLRDAREEHEARLTGDHAAHEPLVQQRRRDALGREPMEL